MELVKIKPMFNRLITTMDTYESDQKVNGVIDPSRTKGSLKEYQTVISVGDTVRGIKEGDLVCINPTRYAVVKHQDNSLRQDIKGDTINLGYKFNTILLDGKECLILYDQDIDFIIEEFNDNPQQDSNIVVPDKPKLLTL